VTHKVAIVIPTWNHRELLMACLASIQAQTFRDYQVIVVDDGSTDDTCQWLAQNAPDVLVVKMSANRGFASAVNAGIQTASSPLIFLLNNDMVLAPNCVEHLVSAARRCDDSAAMFAPYVLFREKPDTVFCAGDAMLQNGRPVSIGYGVLRKEFRLTSEAFGVSAGAALYRADLFEEIGLFDEVFGAYFEDADLSFRARLAGFRAVIVPDALSYHVGSASLEGRHVWRAQQCCRNHCLLVVKNMPKALLFRHGGAILREHRHQIGRVFTVARSSKGFLYALKKVAETLGKTLAALPHACRERVRIQRRRKVDTQLLARMLLPVNVAERMGERVTVTPSEGPRDA